jgi:pimeloyl-ACP methyl ester carboxylesterase
LAGSAVELADGRTLAYAELGDPAGRPLLYFHGLPGSRLDGAPFEADLARSGLRAIALDRPGFGRSSVQRHRRLLDWPGDVAAVADRLGLERFPVVGYSSGGKYAAACAAAMPERLTRVGIVSGMGPPELPGFRRTLSRAERQSMALATRARPAALVYWRVAKWLVDNRPDSFMAKLEAELSEPDRRVLADPAFRAHVLATSRESLRGGPAGVVDDFAIEARPWGFRLEDVRAPVRVWHGDSDRIVPLSHGEYAARAIPGAELTVLEGEGHLLARHFGAIASALAG